MNSGCLRILVDKTYEKELFSPKREQDWHIIQESSKTVDSTKLPEKINSGAIIVQTSKDGKNWITSETETDFYNKLESINTPLRNGEEQNEFYTTTNVQITNGCYYRIIVAYKLQRKLKPSKFLFVDTTEKEEKEQLEIYEFYAYNPSVSQSEKLDFQKLYEFSDVYRVDSQNGFKDPKLIESNDPHNDWKVGKFYVSGYTDYLMDDDIPVFLKVPGDKAELWFNLEQEIDKCNGRTDVKINDIFGKSTF